MQPLCETDEEETWQ